MRFPEFKGEWTKTTLGKMGVLSRGKSRHRPRNDPVLYGHEYPFVQTGDIVASSLYASAPSQFYSEIGLSQSKLWPVGTLCITIAANIGASAILPYPAAFPDSVISFSSMNGNDTRFIKYFLDFYSNRLHRIATSGAQSNLNSKSLSSVLVFHPSSKEQSKDADLLETIDKRIVIQKKIIEDLRALSKTTMIKLLRSSDGWEKGTIGDFLFVKPVHKETNLSREKIISVRLNELGVVANHNTNTLELSGTQYCKREAGDFIYGKQNLFHGAIGIIPKELDGFVSSADIPSLGVRKNVDPHFLLKLVGLNCRQWEKFASGTGSKRIQEKTLLEINVPVPSIQEQRRLGLLFSTFDTEIAIRCRERVLLEMSKKYFLTELFCVSKSPKQLLKKSAF